MMVALSLLSGYEPGFLNLAVLEKMRFTKKFYSNL